MNIKLTNNSAYLRLNLWYANQTKYFVGFFCSPILWSFSFFFSFFSYRMALKPVPLWEAYKSTWFAIPERSRGDEYSLIRRPIRPTLHWYTYFFLRAIFKIEFVFKGTRATSLDNFIVDELINGKKIWNVDGEQFFGVHETGPTIIYELKSAL